MGEKGNFCKVEIPSALLDNTTVFCIKLKTNKKIVYFGVLRFRKQGRMKQALWCESSQGKIIWTLCVMNLVVMGMAWLYTKF